VASGETDPMTDLESKRVVLRESTGRTLALMVVCNDAKDLNVLMSLGHGTYRPDGQVGEAYTSPLKVRFDSRPPEDMVLVLSFASPRAAIFNPTSFLSSLSKSQRVLLELALLDGNEYVTFDLPHDTREALEPIFKLCGRSLPT
jgi:hypothetical protein